MKIFFLIRSLNAGGAERQLVDLAIQLKDRGHDITVCIYYSGGNLEKELHQNGIMIHSFNKKSRWNLVPFLISFFQFFWKNEPEIVYAYLTTANIISVCLKLFIKKTHIVWGIRASNMDLSKYDWVWKFSSYVESKFSKYADKIIVNSYAGKQYSVKNGFPDKKMIVIPNGINTKNFIPQPEFRKTIRKEWKIKPADILIGMVARVDPKKDHSSFIIAASILVKKQNNIKFACVGRGNQKDIDRLKRLSADHEVDEQLLWMGHHDNMSSVYNAFDILCLSSSFGEGFPNVIGEAMACGLPCVTTDVGDSSIIVGKYGIVVPPGNSEKLAAGIENMIERIKAEKAMIKKQVRQHIVAHFDTEQMVTMTEANLMELVH